MPTSPCTYQELLSPRTWSLLNFRRTTIRVGVGRMEPGADPFGIGSLMWPITDVILGPDLPIISVDAFIINFI